ncbi:MAG: hypothetical protein MK130_07775, partial [Puniceicoccaceae bacterium]|nr:hypothetical protein [Puniceicoccaceae bacterium]
KLSELVTLQMAKIEELTLHLIQKEKQLEEQSANLSKIRQQNEKLTTDLVNLHESNARQSQQLELILKRLESLEN